MANLKGSYLGRSRDGYPIYATQFRESNLLLMAASTPQTITVPTDAKYAYLAPEQSMNIFVAPGNSISVSASATSNVEVNPSVLDVEGVSQLTVQSDSNGFLKIGFSLK